MKFTLLMACPCYEVKIQFGGVPMNLFMITIGTTWPLSTMRIRESTLTLS